MNLLCYLYWLPVLNPQLHVLINPVWDPSVFVRIYIKEALSNGGKTSKKTIGSNFEQQLARPLFFIRAYLGKYATTLKNNYWYL